jgi:beta-glucanase (GH16 family)
MLHEELILFKLSLHRFSLSLSCCACAAVLLSACGGGGGSTAPGQTSATDTVSTATTAATATIATTAAQAPSASSAAPASTVAPTASADAIPQTVSASATAAATEAPTPFGQDAGSYALSFSEEFNSFDSSLWNDHIWYQGSNAAKNYEVENGTLKIWPQRDASGKFFDRTIDTDGKFYQTYGYFEVEAKLPKGKGTWPAFWLFNHVGDRRPEIDVMEAYAGGEGWGHTDADGVSVPTAYAPTVWKGDTEGQNMGSKTHQAGVDLSADFHRYAVKWEPNKQTYYFDGKEVLVVNVTMADPMYLMLDLWFGSASGTPDDKTPQGKGNSYEVNYVRAWKFK